MKDNKTGMPSGTANSARRGRSIEDLTPEANALVAGMAEQEEQMAVGSITAVPTSVNDAMVSAWWRAINMLDVRIHSLNLQIKNEETQPELQKYTEARKAGIVQAKTILQDLIIIVAPEELQKMMVKKTPPPEGTTQG